MASRRTGATGGAKRPDARPGQEPRQRSGSTTKPAAGLRAFLYDASAADRTVELSAGLASQLRKDQLLWVDVDIASRPAVEQLGTLVELDEEDTSFEKRLPVRERGDYVSFRISALADSADSPRLETLICIVADAWVVTLHHGALEFIDAFDKHVRADSSLGTLDAPSFLASLLEWELNEYFLALEAVQKEVDRIEEAILADGREEHVLNALVNLRRRVTYLHDGLTPHRYVYSTLAHPSFDTVAGTAAAADFALLNERLEQAVQAAESARDTIVGAVSLNMTMTAQHTNEVMKVLTTISLLLLPAALLAGIFGMNILPHALMHTWLFGVVIALMVGVGAGLLLLIRRHGWL